MKDVLAFAKKIISGNSLSISGDTSDQSPMRSIFGRETMNKIVSITFIGIISFGSISPAFAQSSGDIPVPDNVNIESSTSSFSYTHYSDKGGVLDSYTLSLNESNDMQGILMSLHGSKAVSSSESGGLLSESGIMHDQLKSQVSGWIGGDLLSYRNSLSQLNAAIIKSIKNNVDNVDIHSNEFISLINTQLKEYQSYVYGQKYNHPIKNIQKTLSAIAVYKNSSVENVLDGFISAVHDGERLSPRRSNVAPKLSQVLADQYLTLNDLNDTLLENIAEPIAEKYNLESSDIIDVMESTTITHELGHIYLNANYNIDSTNDTGIAHEAFADMSSMLGVGIYAAKHDLSLSEMESLVKARLDGAVLFRADVAHKDPHSGASYAIGYLSDNPDIAIKIAGYAFKSTVNKSSDLSNKDISNMMDVVFNEFNKPSFQDNITKAQSSPSQRDSFETMVQEDMTIKANEINDEYDFLKADVIAPTRAGMHTTINVGGGTPSESIDFSIPISL